MKLGKKQLELLMLMGSPYRVLLTPDKVSDSLVKRGLLGRLGITPSGLRVLADAHERGELEQFFDKRLFKRPVESGKGGE